MQKEDSAGVYFKDYSRGILSLHDHEAINTNVQNLKKSKKTTNEK